MNLKIQLAALTLISAVATVHAEVRNFRFSGTVDQSLPMASAGTVITGTFSYDTDAEPYASFGEPCGFGYSSATYAVQQYFRATVNGHNIASGPTYVDVVNNSGGNVEDSVSVYGLPMTVDGTSFPEGSIGLYLASGPGKTDVLRCAHAPRKIHVKRYDGMNYGWVMVDGSLNGMLLTFVIDRMGAVHGSTSDDE